MRFIYIPILFSTLITSAFAIEDRNVDVRLPASDNVTVVIENMRGQVEIIGDDSEEVWVKGIIDEKATDFIFEQKGNTIYVQVKMPSQMNSSFWNSEQSESDFTVRLPADVRVRFAGVSSDVSAENLIQAVHLKTVSGDIEGKQLAERVRLETVSGDIDSVDLKGKISLSTVSGDIKDKNSNGLVELNAVSGNIDANGEAKELIANVVSGDLQVNYQGLSNLALSSVSGDVDANVVLLDDGIVKMSSVSGDISLVMQKEANVSVRVDSNAGGKIVNGISDDKVVKAKYGPSSRLETQIGTGAASVKASTVSGTVRVTH
ncbi:DUF4097 family beta strand repeat-containing protein [Thalassotalea sp. PS06]|uniref:DUF4097 family beta strand repeat-containing protein n=1 Tax=Thalassotalea sp. PS06 TaxID=2594005 RepID=UPI00116508BA|nr:DUF4097 family beta strand repeat-containing protein [Thalassotalea sp. PS06]QDP00171.1 DUF4097 family beta strand repeat protein [Thalassotalea sp. PS06]